MSTVNILIKAENKANGVFRSVAREMDEVTTSGGRMSGVFSSVKSLMGTGFKVALGAGAAGAGLLAFGLTKAVAAGSDAQEMMSAFNTVFANTSDKVSAATDKFAASVGRSKYAMRDMAMQFGDTLKPMGFAEDAAGDLAVQMSKLAVDLSSFKNMPVQEAFERLQGTLIGNHDNALAFGVVINENTLKAELARMGADRLTGTMLEQAKVQARINLLMKGTTDAQGDAERTASGWANQMRRLQSTLVDTGTAMGLKLMPVVTPFLTSLADMADHYAPQAIAAFDGLVGKISTSLDTFKSKFDEAGGGMAGFLSGLGSITGAKVTLDANNIFDIDWGNFEIGFDPLKGFTKIKWENVFEFSKTEEMLITTKKFTWLDVFEFSKKEIMGITMERKLSIGDLFSFSIDSDNTIKIKIAATPEIEMDEHAWRSKLRAAGLMGMGIPVKLDPEVEKKTFKWNEIFSFDWRGWLDGMTTFKPKPLGIGDVFSSDLTRPINLVLVASRITWDAVFAFGREVSINVSANLTNASNALENWLTKKAAEWKINPKIDALLGWSDVFSFNLFWSPAILTPILWGATFGFELANWMPSIGTMLAWGSVFSFVLSAWSPTIGSKIGWSSVFSFLLSGWSPSLGKKFSWGDVFSFTLDWFPQIHISWPQPPGWVSWLMGGGASSSSGAGQGAGATSTGSAQGHAMGTGYARGGWTWVGERGPELVNLPSGARVHNAVDSQRMADRGDVGGGLSVGPIYVRNDIDLEALLFQLRDMERRRK